MRRDFYRSRHAYNKHVQERHEVLHPTFDKKTIEYVKGFLKAALLDQPQDVQKIYKDMVKCSVYRVSSEDEGSDE